MQSSDIPVKMPVPFGADAAGGTIRTVPIPSQIGIQDGAASFTDGFPALTLTPEGAGGVPPFGQDMNGLELANTSWLRWAQAGAPTTFDPTFSAAIGGYPKGALVQSATDFGNFWLSTAENNVTDPDAGGSGWITYNPGNFYAVDTGSANAGAITLSPAPPSLAWLTGKPIVVKKIGSANTGAYTLVISGFANKNVHHPDGTNCAAGDLPASGLFTVVYDGTAFEVQSGLPSSSGITVLQLQQQAGNYAVDTGTVNVLVAALTPVPASLASLVGTAIRIKIANTTTSGAPTLNLNSFGAKVITNPDGSTLTVGQLPAGGIMEVVFDGTNIQCLSVTSLLSQMQEQSGNYAPDTSILANSLVITLNPVPVSLASLLGAPIRVKVQTTTTSVNPQINVNGTGFETIINPDGTPLSVGQLPGGGIVELVWDGTNFQCISVARFGVFESPLIDPPPGSTTGAVVFYAHGFGRTPMNYQLFLRCLSADGGCDPGDDINVGAIGVTPILVWANSTYVGASLSPFGPFVLINKTMPWTGGLPNYFSPDITKWKFILRAWI